MDRGREGWKDGWGMESMASCISSGLCSPHHTSLPTSAVLAFCIETDVSQLTFKTKPQLISREENIKQVFFFSFPLPAQRWFVHMLTSLQRNK